MNSDLEKQFLDMFPEYDSEADSKSQKYNDYIKRKSYRSKNKRK